MEGKNGGYIGIYCFYTIKNNLEEMWQSETKSVMLKVISG